MELLYDVSYIGNVYRVSFKDLCCHCHFSVMLLFKGSNACVSAILKPLTICLGLPLLKSVFRICTCPWRCLVTWYIRCWGIPWCPPSDFHFPSTPTKFFWDGDFYKFFVEDPELICSLVTSYISGCVGLIFGKHCSLLRLWISRNATIFEDISPNYFQTCSRILCLYKDYRRGRGSQCQIRRNIVPMPHYTFPAGFFDGAAQDLKGGYGFRLWLNDIHSYKWWLGIDLYTNNFSELVVA